MKGIRSKMEEWIDAITNTRKRWLVEEEEEMKSWKKGGKEVTEARTKWMKKPNRVSG